MSTLGTIRTQVLVRLDANTTAAFLSDTILHDWIDDANKWAASFHKWPYTEGRSSTTFASLATNADGLLEGNYPEGWRADSIRKMRIGGKRVEKRDFSGFLDFIEDYSGDTERMFSDYGRVYYVNPNIDLSGTVAVWGQYTPTTMDKTNDDAPTIFGDNAELGNEAIVEKVLAYAKNRRMQEQEANNHEVKAATLLENLWNKIQNEQFQYHSPDNEGMWEHLDVVEGGYYKDTFKRDQFN